jgi:cytoskeletal protein CcmA (bactofilin family)
VSYFSQSKNERETKNGKAAASEVVFNDAPSKDIVSVLGHGMLVTGNIVCAGSVQIFGRVVGDIHASQLTICEGAKVEGKVIATDTVVQGTFNGTINANAVKLQSTAVVEGEIFSKALTIEQNASFEGVARKLDKPVAAPTAAQAKGEEIVSALAPQMTPHADVIN